MAAANQGPAAGQRPEVPDRAAVAGPDALERELRRMAVLQRRSIVQRRRAGRRPGPTPLGVRAL